MTPDKAKEVLKFIGKGYYSCDKEVIDALAFAIKAIEENERFCQKYQTAKEVNKYIEGIEKENAALKAQIETMFSVGVKTEGEIVRLREGLEDIAKHLEFVVGKDFVEKSVVYNIAKQALGGKK